METRDDGSSLPTTPSPQEEASSPEQSPPQEASLSETTSPSTSASDAGGPWQEKVDGWNTAGVGTRTLKVQRATKHELVIALTDEEKARLAEDLAQIADEEAELDAEIKRQKAEWKEQKEAFSARRANKLGAVRSGKERRVVECDEVYDHDSATHYFAFEGKRYAERAMKEQEYLVGAPKLFVETPAAGDNADGTLVASSEDGKVTKLHGRKPRAKVSNSIDGDVRDVMRDEKRARTKKDHTT